MIAEKTSDFASRITKGEPVGFSLYYFNKEKNRFLDSLVKKLFEREDRIYLRETVVTVLKELIVNAVKANSKRCYFLKNDLNIMDAKDYDLGMTNFKNYILEEKENIEYKLKEEGLKVEIVFKKSSDGTKIYIRNNSSILPKEMKRIQERIKSAKRYNDFSEIYDIVGDGIEGEGLGLLLSLFFLKNSGIGDDAFTIVSNETITQSVITIPDTLKTFDTTNEVQKIILAEIEELPVFPENVRKLQELCRQKEAELAEITEYVSYDPGLTTTILRQANSAGFLSRQKIESVSDALIIIGMRNLKAILAAAGARAIMDQKYLYYQEIWRHCTKVAFYAREIAVQKGRKQFVDKVYLAAMLHDIGKIVLLASSGNLGEWITEISERREMKSSSMIEELSVGISHASIGEKISRKWGLPEYVSETIKFHHSPLLADRNCYDVVFITYLANEMTYIEEGKFGFDHLETDILNIFGIKNVVQFTELHDRVKMKYSDCFGE